MNPEAEALFWHKLLINSKLALRLLGSKFERRGFLFWE
jgi:hypothetical protein